MMNLYGFTLEKLEEYFVNNNQPKFRASQIYEWLYKKRVDTFSHMTNIKKDAVINLETNFSLNQLKIVTQQEDKDVAKYLFELDDKEKVEAVLMYHDYGNSLCISTQVGCNMGCSFCESGRLKKRRNLEVHEMVLQILMVEEQLGIRISHVVLMGIGEPFDNFKNVMEFINIINNPKGIAIGARHITISTCGIIPKIKEFAQLQTQVNLAISLHAPNDELRSKLMPINKTYPLGELIKVIKDYTNLTNRRVTFEYIMLRGINDQEKHAIELSNLLRGINSYVNLIPYNETSHIELKKSNNESVMAFYDTLKKNNVNVTVRREFGSKVMAACGQLRSHHEEEK